MAASAILDADIFIANNQYRSGGPLRLEARWSLIRSELVEILKFPYTLLTMIIITSLSLLLQLVRRQLKESTLAELA